MEEYLTASIKESMGCCKRCNTFLVPTEDGKCSASITVYVSLILCLILSILGVLIESARVSVTKLYSERVFHLALNSALGEYYYPLYEKYHLFALDTGYGTAEFSQEQLLSRISADIEESFDPPSPVHSNFLLVKPELRQLTLDDYHTLLSQNGEILKSQALEFQKYSSSGNVIERILNEMGILSVSEETKEVLLEKQEIEQELYQVDQIILSLVECMDGFSVDDTGIQQKKNGDIQMEEIFIKRLAEGNTGAHDNLSGPTILLQTAKSKQISLEDFIQELLKYGQEAREWKERKTALEHELQIVQQEERKEREAVLSVQDTTGEGAKEGHTSNSLKENTSLNHIILRSAAIELEVMYAEGEYRICMQRVTAKQRELEALLHDTNACIQRGIQYLEQIEALRSSKKNSVTEYMERITKRKEQLGDSFEEFLSAGEQMREYTEVTNHRVGILENVSQMEDRLIKNSSILYDAEEAIKSNYLTDADAFERWRITILQVNQKLTSYSHEGLSIDYGSFQITRQNNTALSALKELMNKSLSSLVLENIHEISKNKLNEEDVISGYEQGVYEEEASQLESMTQDITLGSKASIFENIMFPEKPENIGLSLMEDILYTLYLEEHFVHYLSKEESDHHVLKYEIEYLLGGHLSDENNLDSVIMKILLVRIMCNMLHVFMDAKKGKEAIMFAGTVAGFTGLPFLIHMVKYMVLFLWSVEAAMIDTAAILMNKKIPILVNEKTCPVSFGDLFQMNHDRIIQKAKSIKEEERPGCFSYMDYLRLFLLCQEKTKQYYSTLDLIQANLRYYYDTNFLMEHLVTGYQVKAEINLKSVFLSLFREDMIQQSVNGYLFQIQEAVSYK